MKIADSGSGFNAGGAPARNGNLPVGTAALRARGLALCKPNPGKKNPTGGGWPTRSLEADDFALGDLVGIIGGPLSAPAGHALVIVDLDCPAAVEKADDFLPVTGMEEGRPGKPRSHRYFMVSTGTIPEEAHSTAAQAAPAARDQRGHPGPKIRHFDDPKTGKRLLDFLGTGGQAVCPPSVHHPSGEPREWSGGEPGEPAVVDYRELWSAVCRLAEACGWKPKPPPKTTSRASTAKRPPAGAEGRAVKYLATCAGAVSGKGGHKATLWAARVLAWGFNLGAAGAFPLLRDYYNPRCDPPWSEGELWHKCEDADEVSFDKPRGWLLDEPRPQEGGMASAPADLPARESAPDWASKTNLTDVGNGRRVVKDHGKDLRYCFPWKRWLTYGGTRWAEDETGEAVRRVKQTQAGLYRWAAAQLKALGEQQGEDEKRAGKVAALNKLLAHCLKWEDARRVAACLDMARSEPGIPVMPAELDAHPFLLNVLNGTLDLRTGKLRGHRREDMLTKLAPVEYHRDATCPLWERSTLRWMDGNQDLVTYLQRVVGYGLTGDVSEQSLWFFYGTGANGKSTFLLTLLAMLGDYAMQAVSDLLMVKNHEAHPTERADLFGKRFVVTIETEEGKRLAEALMKQMTGGDKMRARKMRQDFFEFDQTHKIILAANHKPVIRGTDHANWRRIKLVPFTVTIPDEEKDKNLPDKLKAELPGILAWAVRGCIEWQRHGLGEPDEVRQATTAYQAEQDTVQGFLDDCCFVHTSAAVNSSALLDAYHKWSGDKLMTPPAFRERLKDKGFPAPQRGTGGAYFWKGLGLQGSEASEGR
jgi:P4 family phage/plasmid primase-like protien